jgi:hypothetical protein
MRVVGIRETSNRMTKNELERKRGDAERGAMLFVISLYLRLTLG